MNACSLLRISALLCVAAAACQGDELTVGGGDPLQQEDVDDLPPGDAVGDTVTGAYLFTGVDTRACSCRSGSETLACDELRLAGDGLWLTQDDGALEVRLFREQEIGDDLVLRGGIDADGSVRFGGVNTASDMGQAAGQTTNAVEGNVASQGRGDLTWTMRLEAVLGSESVDCDVILDTSIAWWDPASIESCTFAADCHPGRPFCVDDVCTAGGAQEACTFGSDCATGICNGGVCAADEDCDVTGCPGGQICFQSSCQDGAEGDACALQLHCAQGLKCTESTCYDGSEGDLCASGIDCGPQAPRCFMSQCQDGSEGDACDSAVDCGADVLVCFEDRCQDGSAGDPCETNFDCDVLGGLSCDPSGVCG